MASPEMNQLLQKRRLELLKELQAIDVLLASGAKSDIPQPSSGYNKGRLGYTSTRDEHIAMLGGKTDNVSWKDYILKAVTIMGSAPATGVTDLIIDTNDHKIADKRVKEAVSAALKTLVGEKKIGVKADGKTKEYFALS